jgi:hypothetical protein
MNRFHLKTEKQSTLPVVVFKIKDRTMGIVRNWDRSLWSSGQSSWLLTIGLGFDSWRCQIVCVAVGLERGPLSLVRINEELLERKITAPV